MTDRTSYPVAMTKAFAAGANEADRFIQSLHDHGAAMSDEEAGRVLYAAIVESIEACDGLSTVGHLEGFACKIGGRLRQLVCPIQKTTAGQAGDVPSPGQGAR